MLRVLAHKPYATGYDKGKSYAVKQQYEQIFQRFS